MSETPPANSSDAKPESAPGEKKPQRTEGDLIPAGPAGIIALAAVITAGIAIYFFVRKGIMGGVDEMHPVSLMGVNLAFCAFIMAALAAYRCRGIPTQKHSRLGALAAILLSIAGLTLAMFQVVHWRKSTAFGELDRCALIAKRATEYARAHNNQFPNRLAQLVVAPEDAPWRIPTEALCSPFRPRQRTELEIAPLRKLLADSPDKAEALVMEYSDYIYLGADLPGKDKYAMQMDAPKIIIAASKQDKLDLKQNFKAEDWAAFDKRLGEKITVAWASGEARFVEPTELDKLLKESNAARADRELPPMDNFGKLIRGIK